MYILGLYSDGDYFKVSLIQKKYGKRRLEFIKEIKKGAFHLAHLKKALEQKGAFFNKNIEVVTAINPEELFVQKFSFPVKGRSKVLKALKFRLSDEDIYFEKGSYFIPIFQKKGNQTEVALYGYTKEAMHSHEEEIKHLGIETHIVSTIPKAFERFIDLFAKVEQPFFLFHLGWETSFFYFVSNKEVKREVSFRCGLKNIVDAVQKDHILTENVDMQRIQELFIESIDQEKKNDSTRLFFEIEKEISRAWTFILEEEKKAQEVFSVLFTGYSDFSRELKPYLPPIDFQEVVLTPHLEYTSSQLASYAIEIGLALEGAISSVTPLQLAQGEMIPYAQKKRVKKSLITFATLLTLSCGVLFVSLNSILSVKKGELKERYERAISELDEKAHLDIDYKNLGSKRKLLQNEAKKLQEKQKILEGPFPFSSVLEWIAKCDQSSFIVENIEYRIVQAPSLEDPLGGYIVEVAIQIEKNEHGWDEFFLKKGENVFFDREPEYEEKTKSSIVRLRLK